MGAIVLDAKKVDSYVLPGFEKSSSYVQKAYDASSNLKKYLNGYNVSSIINDLYNINKDINDAKNFVVNKVDKAKQIESKNESKISSIASKIGSVAGAAVMSGVGAVIGSKAGIAGTAVGAVVGAKVGSSVGKTIVDTGAKVVKTVVSGAKKLVTSIGNFFKSAAEKIAKAVKSIWQKFSGAIKKVASDVSSVFKKAWQGIKSTCAKVAKKVSSWASSAWNWIKGAAGTVFEHILKIGATIVNVVVSLVEGVVSFIEAIGDVVLLAVGAVCSVFSALVDIAKGIFTGKWDWSATSAIWKKWIMPWVGYDWTSKAFEWQGKWIINDWAYKPFQRGNTGANVVKKVGYVAGIVIASIFTAGAAAGASSFTSAISAGAQAVAGTVTSLSSATIMSSATLSTAGALIAGGAKTAQSVQKGYNKILDSTVDEILKTSEDDESYAKKMTYGEKLAYADQVSGAKIGKLMATSVGEGAIEGGTWYLTFGGGTAAMAGKSGAIKGIGTAFTSKNKVVSTITKATMQATKAFANEGVSVISDGEYDLKDAGINAAVGAISSVGYDLLKMGTGSLDKTTSEMLKKFKPSESSAANTILGESNKPPIGLTALSKITTAANATLSYKPTGKLVGTLVKEPFKDPLKKGATSVVDLVA